MARSSTTRMDRIAGVSRLPSRFRSPRTLATIPDEVTYVTPPSTTAASADQPSSSPAARPGVKLRTRSTSPAGAAARRLPSSSLAEYSRPSRSSSRITPTSAPTSMNSWAVTSGSRPPSPKASPASRYRGIAERPRRPASRARMPRPRMTPPSSRRTAAPWGTPSAPQQLAQLLDALGGADDHEGVARLEAGVGGRGRDGAVVAQDGHDRHPGAAAGLGVGDGPAGVRAARPDGQPVDGQALDPLGEGGQVLDQPGRPQQLGQGVGLLVGELDDLLAGVGVVAVVDQQVAAAGQVPAAHGLAAQLLAAVAEREPPGPAHVGELVEGGDPLGVGLAQAEAAALGGDGVDLQGQAGLVVD